MFILKNKSCIVIEDPPMLKFGNAKGEYCIKANGQDVKGVRALERCY
jgi:hypothetical protein